MGAFCKVKYGLTSGVLWGLDTVILGIALTMSPYIGTLEAFAFAAIASSALHDIFCALWLALYMGVRGRLKDTWAALRTRSGKVVVLGALLGGPVGMTGYVIAINNIGAGYTAIISAFYPAVGAILSFIILKERMNVKQLVAFVCALGGIVAMGVLSLTDAETVGDPVIGLVGAAACVLGWGSEAVLCGWGMRDDAVDNETALQIRETTSALVYAIVVLPAFGAWAFTASAFPSLATGVVALAALLAFSLPLPLLAPSARSTLAALGAVTFVVSDMTLCHNLLLKRPSSCHFVSLGIYYMAQLLLALSAFPPP